MVWLYLGFIAGASIGGCLRYGISSLAGQHRLGARIFTGTLLCNLLGTALLAWLYSGMSFEELKSGSSMLEVFSPIAALLLGVTGGLSTLSTLIAECAREQSTRTVKLLTLGAHTVGCFAALLLVYAVRAILG